MLDKFLSYINNQSTRVLDKEKVLLAVSGGVDSMVMLDLAIKAGLNVEVCHVDHLSRDGQSTEDARFLEDFCLRNKIPFHLEIYKHVEGNFQEGARRFRYKVLKSNAEAQLCSMIWTAHHADDHIESFLMGIIKGSGLAGLKGVIPYDGFILRPLLFASKDEIRQYAIETHIEFVEDQSNFESKYTRNKVRQLLIPAFHDVDPSYQTGLAKTTQFLNSEFNLLEELIKKQLPSLTSTQNDVLSIDKNKLLTFNSSAVLLFYILRGKGFSFDQVQNMLTADTGSGFQSDKFEILIDRKEILLRFLEGKIIVKETAVLQSGKYRIGDQTLHLKIPVNKTGIQLRGIKVGDRLQLSNGMTKSVKKYLIDQKLSRWDKEKVVILEVDGNALDIVLPSALSTNNHLDLGIEVTLEL